LSFRFHDRRRTGDILARLTSDIRFLRDIFVALPLTMTSELLLIVGMITVMWLMDWSLALMALIAVPGIAVVVRMYQRPMRKAIRRQRDREGDIATIASE
ncbi:MAG: ABC transporter ATP-binding protein, partial [Gammaproteobacteria bacterium]|nr:ABC transporter ATP-binding protein [Gammaproteobacteria bacterium]